jgi:glycosyltransferase involved in cell wall biosynthesis
LPSLFEGYPNVICEAMSCGLPVLCSDVCDNLDLIKDGINGFLFNPRSIESIVNAIFKYSQLSIEEIEYIRKSNRKYAIETFNKNDFILKYSILFQ